MFLTEFFGNTPGFRVRRVLMKEFGQGSRLLGRGNSLAKLHFAEMRLIHFHCRGNGTEGQMSLLA